MKYHIEKNTVQETLVIPLYGRKMCSTLYPRLFYDETAIRLMDEIDYDFTLLEKKSKSLMQRFGFLEAAMRQNDLAWEVQAMHAAFPGGRLVFDAANRKAVKLMLKTWLKTADIQDVGAYFAVADAKKELSPWALGMQVSSRGYMLGYHDLKDPSVSGFFRFLSRVGDNSMNMQIVRLEF